MALSVMAKVKDIYHGKRACALVKATNVCYDKSIMLYIHIQHSSPHQSLPVLLLLLIIYLTIKVEDQHIGIFQFSYLHELFACGISV